MAFLEPNKTCEAYTGNHIGQRGDRKSLNVCYSLVSGIKADGDSIVLLEANTRNHYGKVLDGPPGSLGQWHV